MHLVPVGAAAPCNKGEPLWLEASTMRNALQSRMRETAEGEEGRISQPMDAGGETQLRHERDKCWHPVARRPCCIAERSPSKWDRTRRSVSSKSPPPSLTGVRLEPWWLEH